MNGAQSGGVMGNCRCDRSILTALLALSDWAEGTLGNFHRELAHELNPEHEETNRGHLAVLYRFGIDAFSAASAIRNTGCCHPTVARLIAQADRLHETVASVRSRPWSKNLAGKVFVPAMAGLVEDLHSWAVEYKGQVRKAMCEFRPTEGG